MLAGLDDDTLCPATILPCGLKRFAFANSGAGMGRCFVGGPCGVAFSDRPIAPRLLNQKCQSARFFVAPERFNKFFLGSV